MNTINFFLMIKISIFCFIISFPSLANDLIIMKYEYGKPGWNGTRYETASIYPLPDKYFRHSSSYIKNIDIKKKINISLDLYIKNESNSILSTVIFKNNSSRSLFIPEASFSALSVNFLITTDNISLKYLGGQFDYRGNFDRDDWLEIPPGEMISLTQFLNDNYEFLPGKQLYRISSLEYTVVTEEWFTERSIYNSFISIFTPEINGCHIKKNTPYILRKRWLCILDVKNKEVSIEDLLDNFGIHNIVNSNYFRVRTNQKSFEVDGNQIRSFNEKTRN